MTTPLPPSSDYTTSPGTQGAKKTFMTAVRTFLADLLGTSGTGLDGALLAAPRRVTFGGTADAVTATLSPAPSGYVAGMRVVGAPPGANTVAAPTLNLNALGAKTIKKRSGTGTKVALVPGDYGAALAYELEFDGTDFVLANPAVSARVDVASASTLDLSATSGTIRITGTTAVTAVTLASGQVRTAVAAAALPMTNGASLILPGGANYTCAAGDALTFIGEPSGVVRVLVIKADGSAVVAPSSGKLVQAAEATPVTALTTITAVIPHDDTIPLNTEGTQLITVSITPTNASNRLRIEFDADAIGTSSTAQVTTALFQDSNANALAASYALPSGSSAAQARLTHEMAAGTTSSTTFKVRLGVVSGSAYVNGSYSGARVYGGVSAARLRVSEFAP